MGRQQQQFQVLKGAVRQALLRRFHISPPPCSSSFLAREALASVGAAAASRKVGGRDEVRLLSCRALPTPYTGPGSNSGAGSSSSAAAAPQQGNGNALNPRGSSSSSLQELCCSRRAFGRYFSSSSSEKGVLPKVERFLDQEIVNNSSSRCLTASNFSAPLRDIWAAAHLGTSLFWPVRVSVLLAANKILPEGLTSSSRGFASLAEKSVLCGGEKDDSVAGGGQERGPGPPGGRGREGQGGDEGVSASVSGREGLQIVKKQRKKRSSNSLIQEVELPRRSSKSLAAEKSAAAAAAAAAGGGGVIEVAATEVTTSAAAATASAPRRALSKLLDSATADASSSSDNGVLKAAAQGGVARRKRSRETARENIFRAFNENAEAASASGPVDAHASSSSEWVSIRERENASFSPEVATIENTTPLKDSSPSLSNSEASPEKSMPQSIITTAEGISERNFGGPSAYRESGPPFSDRNGVGRAQHLEEEAISTRNTMSGDGPGSRCAAVVQKPFEEVLRKDTFNSAAVEVPAISARTDPIRATGTHENQNIMGPELVRTAAGAAIAGAKGTNGTLSSSTVGIPSEGDVGEFADPKALYQALLESKGGRAYQNQEKSKLSSIFYRFTVSGWVSDQALSLYINSKFFPSAASKFRKFFMHKSSQNLRSSLVSKGATNETLELLFPLFAEFCIHQFPNEINRYRELVHTADMTKPDAWYPFARAIKRKIVYHKGPTNSGKTYNALKRFMESSTGIYCSPLRLLAMEVFDTVNMQGVYCNLHTGQEKRDVPFAKHLACTIEMCYLTTQWDVAVIDEIQMMSDEYRGWAWTRAFLGLQADEIHVCGDPSALPLIRNLCSGTGDELVEYEYERFKPLKVAEESLKGDFRNVEAGDCIVAFSRRDIFDIKREVELATKHRCCVVYGALPPETRTQQAKLFNTVNNGYDVLVASDAIGMGLNLNIRRVVFFSLDKFDGDSKRPVAPAQVKQIAGRAGRRGSLYPEGVTSTFFSQDLPYLSSSMLQDFHPATAAGLFPVFEQVELFASQLPNENFAKLLERFSETCKLDGAFFLSRYDNLKRVANMLEKVKGLSLEDRFNFCFAPVNVRDPQSMGALYRYATAFSQKIPVHVEMGVPSSSARDELELVDLEARHQVLSMYLWLSQHFPGDLFPQREQAGEMASQIAVLLGQSLVQSSRRWSKRKLVQPQYRGSRPFANSSSRPESSSSTSSSSSRSSRQSSGSGPGWVDAKSEPVEIFVPA